MGYMCHHAIVVTGRDWGDSTPLKDAYKKAVEIFGKSVTEILPTVTNGYASFMVGPDGSKEGWEESDTGNARRDEFVLFLDETGYCKWAEVQYGDDEDINKITRCY